MSEGPSRHPAFHVPPRWQSIPSGDVVLCNLPPYATQPWLSAGVVLIAGRLQQSVIRARVVRPLEKPEDTPLAVIEPNLLTMLVNPPFSERLAWLEDAWRRHLAWFEGILDRLLAGPETIFGLSISPNSVDLTLVIARRLKELLPGAIVILGGPEAVEEGPRLLLPWIDAVVGADADAVIVPLLRGLLENDRRTLHSADRLQRHSPAPDRKP